VCSNFLNNFTESKTIKAKIKRNLDFHFPAYANEVIMIANGTGIAPFIGMITQKHQNTNTHLFWGGRTKASLQLYDTYIKDALQTKQLNNFYLTYS
jgi:sulfite reductase (NADPH) flavoprotein alpha-component